LICLLLFGTAGIRETTAQPVTVLSSSDLLSMEPSRFAQWLAATRPAPVSVDEKARTLNELPEEGEVVHLNEGARRKLASLTLLLQAVGRKSIYEFKVIDVPQAVMGLHARSVVLISAPALRLLDADELQALLAHEVGHEYIWPEYERRTPFGDVKELELVCDGIAIVILRELGIDASRLIGGIEKLARFNERFKKPLNEASYPTVAERRAFARAVTAWAARRTAQ
jgi:hypothetical protein